MKMIILSLFAMSSFAAFANTSVFSQEPVNEVYGIRNCDIYVDGSSSDFDQVSEILSEKGFTVVSERTYPNLWETDFLFNQQIHFRNWMSNTPDFINVSLSKIVQRPGSRYEFSEYDFVVSFEDVPHRFRPNRQKILRATRKFPKCLLVK
jgi:hypothetical protein